MDLEQLIQACHPVTYACANAFPLTVWRLPTNGPKAKKPKRVLCVHGFLDSGRSFLKLAQALPSNYEIYAPDLRGHGGSRPLPPGAATHYWEHAKDLSILLDTFAEYDQAFELVVGHSMGANVAALTLGSRMELTQQLIILDILGGMPEKPTEQPARFGEVLKGLKKKKDFKPINTPQEAIQRLKKMNPYLSEEGAKLMALTNIEPHPDSGYQFAFAKDLKGKTPFRFPQEFWLALFSNLKNKTWVFRGENGLLPKAQDEPLVKERLERLGLSRARTIEGKGHHLHVDAAEEIASFILTLPSNDEERS